MDKKAVKQKKCFSALCRFFLYSLSGMLTALPLAIPTLWPLGWVAPAPVIYCELCKKHHKDSYIRAYGRGMSFFLFFGIIVFYWFLELYPLDFLGFDKSAALATVLLASLGIPFLQGCVSSFVFVLLCFLRRRGFTTVHPVLSGVFFAAAFVLSEYCHTLTWAGVPWGRLAAGQVGCLYNVQSASLFGSYFIAFIMILTSALLALAIEGIRQKKFKRSALLSLLALAVFLANFTFGAVKTALPEKEGEVITAAAVQGNIRFEDKWAGKEAYTMELYRELSVKAADAGAELIIWPETALPYDLSDDYYLLSYFSQIGADSDCEVLVTVFEKSDGKLYNTARLVSDDGTVDDTVYKKRHLVPFGEYIPMESFVRKVFPPLALLSSMMEQLSPGDDTEIIETKHGRLGTLICFDSIYESLSTDSVRDGAELIALSTNDSWFSGSAALSQHNAQAQLRAIENSRYVVRSANTGISSIISPEGEILAFLGDGESGYICADVRFIESNTLYTSTGNIFVVLCALFVICVSGAAIIENKKRDKA